MIPCELCHQGCSGGMLYYRLTGPLERRLVCFKCSAMAELHALIREVEQGERTDG